MSSYTNKECMDNTNSNNAPVPRIRPSLPNGSMSIGQFLQATTPPGMSPAEINGKLAAGWTGRPVDLGKA